MPKTVRRIEVESQTEYLTLEKITEVLQRPCVKKFAYILHDKDVYTSDDFQKGKCSEEDIGSLKKPHYHVLLWFWSPQQLKYISEWFGVAENYLNTIKSNVGAVEYLTHKNRPEKYQYDNSEVVSSFDTEQFIEKERDKIDNQNDISDIIDLIDREEIKQYNLYSKVSCEVYVKNKKKIDNAFEYVRNRKRKDKDRIMNVVYIWGESGSGKTTYAKMLASEKKYDYFISGSGDDFLDGYQGEPCVILDEVRPSSMALTTLLKMLDNNTASSVSSRYFNKWLDCKLVILTSTKPLTEFFKEVQNNETEVQTQLKRRITTVVYSSLNEFIISTYVPSLDSYKKIASIPNPVTMSGMFNKLTEDECIDKSLELLGSIGDAAKATREFRQKYGSEVAKLEKDNNDDLPF